jgi:IclR family transcriptional regulator, KDG regulon repressor
MRGVDSTIKGVAASSEVSGDRETTGTLRIVHAVLDVFLVLSRSGKEAGVRELARIVGVPKSTVARIVATLTQREFVQQNEVTLQYRLGPRILEITAGYYRSLELRKIAFPEMTTLAATTGESVFLGVLDGTEVVILDRVDGSEPLRMMTEPGAREPVYCTGLGKVLLAGMPEAVRELSMRKIVFQRMTDRTITSLEALREHVVRVIINGYAFDDQEFQYGASCIAVPIREYGGRVKAALSISGPAFRIGASRTTQLIRMVTDAGLTISRKFGHDIEKDDDFLTFGAHVDGRAELEK